MRKIKTLIQIDQEKSKLSYKSQKMTPQQHHQSTSKKRLLSTHQKPEQGSKPGPGQPIIPADDQLLLPPKKTRDLPNLSDCHGCGLRINHTNPKDRLQTLDSVWRIVLLCKKCIKRVESGQTCAYCFKESAKAECCKCRDCERLIHKDCVADRGCSPPWSFCERELGTGFTVCVDCWVPKVFRKSIRIRRRKNWKDVKKLGPSDSKGIKNGGRKQQDANCLVGREIVIALRAQRKRLTKAEVRREGELANGAAKVVAKKGKDGKKTDGLDRMNSIGSKKCGENTSVTKAVGDAELAFQLHRAMNSSSRNLKNLCLVNTGSLDVFSESREESGSSVEVGRLKAGLLTYKRTRKLKNVVMTYKRGCLKRKRFLENADVGSSNSVVGKSPGDDESKINSGSCSSQQCELKGGQLNDGDVAILVKSDSNDTKQGAIFSQKADRYLLKYSKRSKGSKLWLSPETRIISETFKNEIQIGAPEVPMNCSVESRTLSTASFNSYVVDLQTYGCVEVHQEKSP